MRALLIDYRDRRIREGSMPEPRLEAPDDVLFRVLEVGVCGTDRDLAAFRFGHGPAGDDFLVPGHEAAGQVIASGPDSGFQPGDIVVPTVRRACSPACRSCGRGRRDLCVTGGYTERGIFGAHGYFTEIAVDRASDLVRLPADRASAAVLIEPLSVVEKAVAAALRMHPEGPHSKALVMGAGTIGLLAAAVLKLRGLDVDVVSTEPPGSRRARLAESIGARFLNRPDGRAEIAIEAAGAPQAAAVALAALAPLGVLVVLGAMHIDAPLLGLITGNQTVIGSVNASPEAFRHAVEDLARLPAGLTNGLIERRGFAEYSRSFADGVTEAPKIVHVMS